MISLPSIPSKSKTNEMRFITEWLSLTSSSVSTEQKYIPIWTPTRRCHKQRSNNTLGIIIYSMNGKALCCSNNQNHHLHIFFSLTRAAIYRTLCQRRLKLSIHRSTADRYNCMCHAPTGITFFFCSSVKLVKSVHSFWCWDVWFNYTKLLSLSWQLCVAWTKSTACFVESFFFEKKILFSVTQKVLQPSWNSRMLQFFIRNWSEFRISIWRKLSVCMKNIFCCENQAREAKR